MRFKKIINYITLVAALLWGIVIPIIGITAHSFMAVCTGIFIIIAGFDDFIETQKRIKEKKTKNNN